MPYLLTAPASMATNSGACGSDTAGTATLIVFSDVSAANVGAVGKNKKAIKEIGMIQRFMFRSFSQLVRPDYPKRVKMSSLFATISILLYTLTHSGIVGNERLF